ncbi:MAG TPA: response regulator, partial [Desulfosarcina sp.]|nr:response regulator [Desulfosarcina sp.]
SGETSENNPLDDTEAPEGRGELILMVEDEPAILNMGRMMLERAGYRVLAVNTPKEAIRTAEARAGEIHLLMTDVVMPEMNGRDLAERLLAITPNLKILFMSGYTANVIAHHGVLDEDVQFIQKPFSKKDLAVKVRAVLDQ